GLRARLLGPVALGPRRRARGQCTPAHIRARPPREWRAVPDVFFELVTRPYEGPSSIVLSTNKPLAGWPPATSAKRGANGPATGHLLATPDERAPSEHDEHPS